MNLRKIDALIAEHVFRYVITNPELFTRPGDDREYLLPKCSSDISAAWEVIAKLNNEGVYLSIHTGPNRTLKVNYQRYKSPIDLEEGFLIANTVPLAICLVALKLKGVKYD